MSFARATLLGVMATTLSATPAAAIGTLVGPDGATITMEASRTLLIRHADRIQLITQIKYDGRPAEFDWLIALPNVNNAIDSGVRVSMATQTVLDELANTTHPVLNGECDGNATGAQARAYQVQGDWGPTANEAQPSRIFEAAQIENGDLDNYLTETRGYTIDEALRGALNDTLNLNYMFAVVHINTADVGVDKIDPIVSISWPDADDTMSIGTRVIDTMVAEGGKADMLFWTLAGGRAQGSFVTREMDFAEVFFNGPTDTNYLGEFDRDVGRNQTQAFITEFAQPVSSASFESELLESLRSESGASFLTRLHVRMIGPVFRSNAKTFTFTMRGAAAYGNTHTVEGLDCDFLDPEMGVDDMGPDADTGVEPTDMDVQHDGGGSDVDAGQSGSGGGGGCSQGSRAPAWPLLFAVLPLIALRRRRR